MLNFFFMQPHTVYYGFLTQWFDLPVISTCVSTEIHCVLIWDKTISHSSHEVWNIAHAFYENGLKYALDFCKLI